MTINSSNVLSNKVESDLEFLLDIYSQDRPESPFDFELNEIEVEVDGKTISRQETLEEHLGDVLDLRIHLISSELEEYLAAEADKDHVEMFDGLLDIMVTVGGTLVTLGLQEYYRGYSFPEVVRPDTDPRDHVFGLTVAFMEAIAVLDSEAQSDPYALALVSYLGQLTLTAVYNAGLYYGYPMTAGWDEVDRSNRTKAKQVVNPDTGIVTYEVTKNEHNKVIKPEWYSAPDLPTIYASSQEG